MPGSDPNELESIVKIDNKFSVTIDCQQNGLVEFTVHRNWGGLVDQESGIIITKGTRWIVIYTGDKPIVIEGMLHRFQPLLHFSRLSSIDFINLAKAIRNRKDSRLRITEAFLGKTSQNLTARKNIELDELENYVINENRWIGSLTFLITKTIPLGPKVTIFRFGRLGEVRLFSGGLSIFLNEMADNIFSFSEQRIKFWNEKQSSTNDNQARNTVRISYGKVLDNEKMHLLIEAVDEMEQMHYTVAQKGNPFLLLHLLDSIDGSCLWICSNR